MTPLGRGILSSAKLGGASNFAKYNMSLFNASYGVVVPDNASLDLTNDFSGCAFVYPNNNSSEQWVIGKFNTSGNNISWFFYVTTSGFLAFIHSVDGTANTTFTTTINVPLSTLSLVHFRLTGGTLYIGKNGASEQSIARGSCFSGTAAVEIGRANTTNFADDFNITQPMLFNSGSSLANFETIYNSGMPCKYSLIDTAITDDAVMAFELSSNDISLTDLSTAGNDGAFVGGSFTNGHLTTWKIGPIGSVSSLLLHMDGTNGSTTFIDSASSANTIAANGNAQLSTAGAKFGTACGLFDGSGDSISIAAPNFEFGSSDFCIDFWVNNSLQDGQPFFEYIFADDNPSTNRNRFEFYTVGGGGNQGKVAFEFFRDNVTEVFFVSASTFGSGSYQHVALTREGDDFRLFISGNLSSSASSSTATKTSSNFNIGRVARHLTFLTGRLDEFRVVIGDAVYTSNFTPPTNPYAS